MNHDKLARRLRTSASLSEFAVSMARSCSPGSTGSPVASSRGGKTLHHRRAISSADHGFQTRMARGYS
jgi:hypothetical protein